VRIGWRTVALVGLAVAAVAVPVAGRGRDRAAPQDHPGSPAGSAVAVHTHGDGHHQLPTEPVTAAQRAAADELLGRTMEALWTWLDDDAVAEAGFRPTVGGLAGYDHLVNWSWIDDDVVLDPEHPESLVYRVDPDGRRTLEAAMFVLPEDTADADVPEVGGPLTQWHRHDNLCFGPEHEVEGEAQRDLRSLAVTPGVCPPGQSIGLASPMLHVWVVPRPCGPFAPLEGEGSGIALREAEDRPAPPDCPGGS
jgi:hypothetical protein